MTKMKGKTVLITGAAGGIGFATAECFAKANARVILTDVNAEAVHGAARRLTDKGFDAMAHACDVTKIAHVKKLAADVTQTHGGIDVLINNAGIGYAGELAETSLSTWKRLVNVNLFGPLHHVDAFLPAMIAQGAGHIVNVSSGQAFFRLPTWGAYAAVKLAVGAWSELLGVELAKYGVSVTTVYPFMVNTGFYDKIEAETWGQRMSMKLLPYYSHTPEKVGRIIFRAVERKRKVEMVSVINDVGYFARLVPPVAGAMAYITNRVLAGPARPHASGSAS
ncbi:SDR family oxidoreductase [bacterium]|nr:SDR family oxidoreductase [bacterium]